MNISACVITKNEEKNLPVCLSSLQSIVSEIIVVDTGSTDKTVEVAQNFGAKVYHFSWVNDFAKAKNFALSKATGDWIIFLDADEYFTNESLPLIPLLIKEAEEKDCDIIVSLLCNIDVHTKETINTVYHARIFRNHPDIRYEGAIHERILRAGRAPKGLMASNALAIIHTGYSSDINISKNKSERNIKLLLNQLEEDPESGEVYFYLAESYMAAREFELALENAIKSAELDNCTLLGVKQKNYLNIITCMIHLKKENEEIQSWIRKGIKQFPEYPDFYFLLADIHSQAGRYQDSLEAYTLGMKYIDNALMSQSAAPHQTHKIFTVMGELYWKIGQIHDAVRSYVSALNIDKYYSLALVGVMKLFTRFESASETKKFLLKIYDVSSKKDLLYLTRASIESNNKILASYFISLFNEKDLLLMREEYAECSLLRGDYTKAATMFNEINEKKQNQDLTIKLLCATYLSGDRDLFYAYFKDSHYNDVHDYLDNINREEFYRFISYLIRIQRVDKVLSLQPFVEKHNIENEVAELLMAEENFVEAAVFFNNYISHAQLENENRAVLLVKQGECLWRSGKSDDAKALGYQAKSVYPKDYRSYSLLMSILSETGEMEELSSLIQEAIQFFPDSNFLQTVLSFITQEKS